MFSNSNGLAAYLFSLYNEQFYTYTRINSDTKRPEKEWEKEKLFDSSPQ